MVNDIPTRALEELVRRVHEVRDGIIHAATLAALRNENEVRWEWRISPKYDYDREEEEYLMCVEDFGEDACEPPIYEDAVEHFFRETKNSWTIPILDAARDRLREYEAAGVINWFEEVETHSFDVVDQEFGSRPKGYGYEVFGWWRVKSCVEYEGEEYCMVADIRLRVYDLYRVTGDDEDLERYELYVSNHPIKPIHVYHNIEKAAGSRGGHMWSDYEFRELPERVQTILWKTTWRLHRSILGKIRYALKTASYSGLVRGDPHDYLRSKENHFANLIRHAVEDAIYSHYYDVEDWRVLDEHVESGEDNGLYYVSYYISLELKLCQYFVDETDTQRDGCIVVGLAYTVYDYLELRRDILTPHHSEIHESYPALHEVRIE